MYATQNGGCICKLASLSKHSALNYFFVLVSIDTLDLLGLSRDNCAEQRT